MSVLSEPENTDGSLATSPSMPKSPLSPQLKIEPASKWADNTLSALDSTDRATHTPTITPGPDLPGAYPYTPSALDGPSFEEVKDTAKEYFQTASQYVPSQEDLKKAAHNAGSTIRGFIPNSVVTYLDPSQLRQEAVTASPIDESETTPTAGGGFVLLNRGVRRTNDLIQGDHDAQHNSFNDSGITYGEMSKTSESYAPERNGHPKSDSTGSNVAQSSGSSNGQVSADASTRTQHGSSAVSEQETEGIPTPFSYTGHTISGASSIDHGDSEVRTAATYGPSLGGHTTLVGNPRSKMNGQPEGVVNHGGAKVELVQGALTAPDSGITAEPRPGPGVISGQAILGDGIRGESTGSTNDSGQAEGVNRPELKGSPQHDKEEEKLDREQKATDRKMSNDIVNTAPRTHPLGKEGSQWKGVPLEEEYQAALDRDEDRGLVIGESHPPAIPNAKPGTISKKGDSHSMKASMKDVNSSTATTGHGGASPQRGLEQTFRQPRPASPMTAEDNLHAGRATTGPNLKKLREPSSSSSEGEQNRGRHRGNFLNKIKTWSKRLSRERKAKN